MSTAPSVRALPSTASLGAGACVACPHPLADHDRISLRFCQATQATQASRAGGTTTRGCVCPS